MSQCKHMNTYGDRCTLQQGHNGIHNMKAPGVFENEAVIESLFETEREDIIDSIDLLADLCVHWKRNREKGRTPKSVQAAIVLQCSQISSRDLGVRSIEDRIKALEDARVKGSIDELSIQKINSRVKDIEDSQRESHRYFMERTENQSKMFEHVTRSISSTAAQVDRLRYELTQMNKKTPKRKRAKS